MDGLTASVYTYLGDTIILRDGRDWWALDVHHVDDQDETSDIAVELVNGRYASAPLELGARIGEMSRANCVSLVQIADLAAHRFRPDPTCDTPADSVVGSLGAQGIIERIHFGALAAGT